MVLMELIPGKYMCLSYISFWTSYDMVGDVFFRWFVGAVVLPHVVKSLVQESLLKLATYLK